MSDLISRKALCEYALNQKDKSITPNDIMRFPSAQPETHDKRTKTHACDLIERQAAIDAILAVTGNSSVRELYEHVQEHGLSDMWSGGVNAAIDIIIAVPSAQPKQTNSCYTNSWCNDCKEYDKEKHSCPRFNRVIKQTIDKIYSHAEIVRCKDCKWFHDIGCAIQIVDDSDKPSENDYCSFAERKTDVDANT